MNFATSLLQEDCRCLEPIQMFRTQRQCGVVLGTAPQLQGHGPEVLPKAASYKPGTFTLSIFTRPKVEYVFTT